MTQYVTQKQEQEQEDVLKTVQAGLEEIQKKYEVRIEIISQVKDVVAVKDAKTGNLVDDKLTVLISKEVDELLKKNAATLRIEKRIVVNPLVAPLVAPANESTKEDTKPIPEEKKDKKEADKKG